MESIAQLINRSLALPIRVLIAATVLSLVLQTIAQSVLNIFYARSQYPVAYFVGQTSFDAEKLEDWYQVMDEAGTIGVYWQTQFVDFAFIAATALLHYWLLLLITRLLPVGRWRRIGLAAVVIGLLAPAFDVLENLVSFIALSNTTEILPVTAIVYSSFASLKFLSFFAVYLWVPVGVVAAAVLRIRRRNSSPAPTFTT